VYEKRPPPPPPSAKRARPPEHLPKVTEHGMDLAALALANVPRERRAAIPKAMSPSEAGRGSSTAAAGARARLTGDSSDMQIMLEDIKKHWYAEYFLAPVDAALVPDYHNVVKRVSGDRLQPVPPPHNETA
jgi:hypothetical protein